MFLAIVDGGIRIQQTVVGLGVKRSYFQYRFSRALMRREKDS